MKIIACALVLFLASCHHTPRQNTTKDLDKLITLMTGSFSSIKQSQTDESYYDIHLNMAPIWPDNANGRWLYVEQAVSTYLNKPYRQRIYHVTALADGQFASAVYELPQPQDYIGAYKDTERFTSLKPGDLNARQGCTVFLNKTAKGKFSGSTDTNKCLSSLRGATYATSIVEIDQDKITSWDRGFDKDDQHVWGAEKGAYVFDRQ